MADVEITAAPAPVKVMVPRFDCPYCGSGFRSSKRALVVEHMKICWSDKAKRTCRTCAFHIMPGSTYDDFCRKGVDLPERAPAVGCALWADQDEDDPEDAES